MFDLKFNLRAEHGYFERIEAGNLAASRLGRVQIYKSIAQAQAARTNLAKARQKKRTMDKLMYSCV